ncbi:hypothetical protein OBBRIDRAFT_798559 [Obba rivulosa]|uniref:Uncharacterized protein n=1 Tax=Obba rivulosa TaxID=1052685 RepID=A0A8E2AIG3_9APHY|nr:hypothetical protein OBBRIDRAFT_798559 [Obba rivulosa]
MYPAKETWACLALLACFVASALHLNATLLETVRRVKAISRTREQRLRPIDSFSYVGRDYPERLPIERQLVKMIIEESNHYSLDDPEAHDEWLWTAPVGDNHIRLGPEKRMFAVAMVHQLHCLRNMRIDMLRDWDKLDPRRRAHDKHCLNYIRQWVLCDADTTLEPGDWTKRNFTVERVGAIHTCPDWRPVFSFIKENWFEFEDWAEEQGFRK